MTEEAPVDQTSIVKSFFSNPWVGGCATLSSVISIPISIYLYRASISEPNVMFGVNPVKTAVVRQASTSPIEVIIGGTKVETDLTAIQVVVWNAGSKAVRPDQVLEPLVIRTVPKVPILEAKLIKQTREVVGFQIDTKVGRESELECSWRILEPGDGAVLQLLIAGNERVHLSAVAAIEGQRQIRERSQAVEIKTPSEQVKEQGGTIVLLSIGGFFSLLTGLALFGEFRKGKASKSDWLWFLFSFGLTLWLLWAYVVERALAPPLTFS